MDIYYFLVAFAASVIGSISGIGGGVIIKPVLDSLGTISVQTASFLSGCTVLSMALANYIKNLKSAVKLDYSISIYLAVGGSAGGILGKWLFNSFSGNLGLVQAILLMAINALVLLYVLKKHRIKTKRIHKPLGCIAVGLTLGLVSSFLGIGGGPLNIVVLSYFFSLNAKETARNSLFIILISQFTSLMTNTLTDTVPEFSISILLLMCIGGIIGAEVGSRIFKKLDEKKIEKLFVYLILLLIAINIYNIVVFL